MVLRSSKADIHCTPPTSFTEPANSQSLEQMPGVVTLLVVVVVAIVVVVDVVELASSVLEAVAFAFCAANNNSFIEIVLGAAVDQPVNSFVGSLQIQNDNRSY